MSVLLRKALEAGDQVIAHTPGTKKPIFANKGADHPHYANYSAGDHIVAANVHANRAKELNIASSRAGGSMTLKRQAAQSTHFATTHRQAGMGQHTRLAASMAAKGDAMRAIEIYRGAISKAGGPGSRGGNVVGHTASGHPIYGADHHIYQRGSDLHAHGTYSKMSAKDHADAAKFHHQAAQNHQKSSLAHTHTQQKHHPDSEAYKNHEEKARDYSDRSEASLMAGMTHRSSQAALRLNHEYRKTTQPKKTLH